MENRNLSRLRGVRERADKKSAEEQEHAQKVRDWAEAKKGFNELAEALGLQAKLEMIMAKMDELSERGADENVDSTVPEAARTNDHIRLFRERVGAIADGMSEYAADQERVAGALNFSEGERASYGRFLFELDLLKESPDLTTLEEGEIDRVAKTHEIDESSNRWVMEGHAESVNTPLWRLRDRIKLGWALAGDAKDASSKVVADIEEAHKMLSELDNV